MRIGIDISQIVYEGSGVSRFTTGLVHAILSQKSTHTWVFFFSSLRRQIEPQLKSQIEEKGHTLYTYKLPPTALSFLWNTVHRMKIEKLIGNCDWIITSDWTEPPSRMKKATIVHDLVFMKYPETVHESIRTTQQKRLTLIQKESSVIFTDSYATKNDLIEQFNIQKEKITVNYPGIDLLPTNTVNTSSAQILKNLQITKPFILTVGKLEPRKNIPRLIQAFDKLSPKNTQLVIAGSWGWGDSIPDRKQTNSRIRFLNYVTDAQLRTLYEECVFFIYPSLYEGFGYPVVEAMQYGAPVATSDSSSLKEIAFNNAVLFNPHRTEEIQSAISLLLTNQKLRLALKKSGIIRSRDFNWVTYLSILTKRLESHN